MKKLLCVLCLVAVVFGGIQSLGFGQTISSARHVVNNPGFGSILQNAKLVVITWPYKGNWAFVVFPRAGSTLEDVMNFHKGMVVDAGTEVDMVKHWLSDGFVQIDNSEMPPEVSKTLYSAWAYLTGISNFVPALWFIPVGILHSSYPKPEVVQQ